MADIRQLHEGGHAIASAVFGVVFSGPPSVPTIRELLPLHTKFIDDHPRRRETTGASVGIAGGADAGGISAQIGETRLTGFEFDSLKPNGEVERAIKMEGRSLAVFRADYDKWETTWPRVREIFGRLLPTPMESLDVTTIQLHYNNRFIWTGDRADFHADVLFRTGSRLLTPNIFEVSDLWHSYHGYFDNPDEPARHKRLTIVEVQAAVIADTPGVTVTVELNQRSNLPEPIRNAKELLGQDDQRGLLDAYIEGMHTSARQVLAETINDDMCDAIGLPRNA